MDYLITIDGQQAVEVAGWLKNQGGLLQWDSADLADLGRYWHTPRNDSNGNPFPKPHWKAGKVDLWTDDPREIGVATYREAERFHVAIRRAELSFKLTDGSTRRLWRKMSKYPDATYHFDYATQEAVILVPAETISLADWITSNPEVYASL